MTNDEIIKDLKIAENIKNRIKEASKNCDPKIVYPLGELQSVTDRLFKKLGDIKKDRSLDFKFNEIIKDVETYRGDFTYNCDCKKKDNNR